MLINNKIIKEETMTGITVMWIGIGWVAGFICALITQR